jgi:SWI/SNF-related matrix-associated actin-dependent regulator of chromatin subfamily B member 1
MVNLQIDLRVNNTVIRDQFLWVCTCIVVIFGSPHVLIIALTPIYSTLLLPLGGQDIGNLDSDPEEFARTLCDDLNITDPEVGVCPK